MLDSLVAITKFLTDYEKELDTSPGYNIANENYAIGESIGFLMILKYTVSLSVSIGRVLI